MPDFTLYPVRGVDVSRYQGVIDWRKVAASGIQFAAIRSTIGAVYKDPRFFANWKGAKNAGMSVTAYHVVRYDATPEAQLTNFLGLIDEAGGEPDMKLVLDIELPALSMASPSHRRTIINARDMILSEELGDVVIYTGAWWWNPATKGFDISSFPETDLWVASYTEEPRMPKKPWTDWRIWQHTSSGQVPGINNLVDMNVWNGDYQSFLDAVVTRRPTDDFLPPIETRSLTLTIKGRGLQIEVNGL